MTNPAADIADLQAKLNQLATDYQAETAATGARESDLLLQLSAASKQLTDAQVLHAADLSQHGIDIATIENLQTRIAAMQQVQSPLVGFPVLAWHDEFDSLDLTKWNVRNLNGENNDASINLTRNVTVANGQLQIKANRETVTGSVGAKQVTRQYSTGYIDSAGKLTIPKGSYCHVRAAMPMWEGVSSGLWGAIWSRLNVGTLELDWCECWGTPTPYDSSQWDDPHGRFNVAVWPDTNSQLIGAHGFGIARNGADLTAPHDYGLLTDDDGSITFMFDHKPCTWTHLKTQKTYTRVTPADFPALNYPSTDSMHLRINLSVGQPSWYGLPTDKTDFSKANMVLDNVRCWTKR